MTSNSEGVVQLHAPRVKCRDCVRWYGTADQCHVPACGIPTNERDQSYRMAIGNGLKGGEHDEAGRRFLESKLRFIHYCSRDYVYGHPSELNGDGNCYFYKPLPKYLRWAMEFFRTRYFSKSG